MSAARGLGAAAVVLGFVLLGATAASVAAVSWAGDVEEDPDSQRFMQYVRGGLLWTLLPVAAGTLLAGGGLMAHQAWARPLMLAMVPWHILSGLGIPVAVAALWVLTRDEADAVLA